MRERVCVLVYVCVSMYTGICVCEIVCVLVYVCESMCTGICMYVCV